MHESNMPNLDRRPYFVVTNDFATHHKTQLLSDAGFRAVIELWSYCNNALTDGAVPATLIDRKYKRVKKELIDVGYLEKNRDGYRMHDYLKFQKSSTDIDKLRDKKRAAGAKGGKTKAHNLYHKANGVIEPSCEMCLDELNESHPVDHDIADAPAWAVASG